MGNLRLFVAVEIPLVLRSNIRELQRELPDEGIQKVALENFHFTMKFLGSVEKGKLPAIRKALQAISFKSFIVVLKGVGVFPNENYIRVIWIGAESEALTILAQQVQAALPSFSQEKFSAHLTIARVKLFTKKFHQKLRVDVKNFLEKHREDEFGRFEASTFHLKQSELSPEGPRYTTVVSFPAAE